MPKYHFVDVTCYCGRQHNAVPVGEHVRCACGIRLRCQQKHGGTGLIHGTIAHRKRAAYVIRWISGKPWRLAAKFQAVES